MISKFPGLIQEKIDAQRKAKIHSMIQERKMIVERIGLMVASHDSIYEKAQCSPMDDSPFNIEESVESNDLFMCKKTSFSLD